MVNIIDKYAPLRISHLEEGAMLLIDKPLEWTSFDVVNKIRFGIKHFLQVKKYKVGHAGTLDPLASGLLILCIGKYTKRIESLTLMNKTYSGIIQIGAETPTYDSESKPNIYFPKKQISSDDLLRIQKQFTGIIDQVPPIYSAIKLKGIPLYKLARRGKEAEIKSRKIEISSLQLEIKEHNKIEFEVSCSKGTYIRSLAHDIGKFLHTGAYLAELRRTSVGKFSVNRAISIQDFTDQLSQLKAS